MAKYIAQVYVNGYVHNYPVNTITQARRQAEEFSATASSCAILKVTKSGPYPCVARHVRDTAGDGTRWFKA